MKKTFAAALIIALGYPPIVVAGVAMELVTTNLAGSETARTRIFADGDRVRMDELERGERTSVIFLGSEFVVLDHKDKSYIVMDEAMLNEVSAQISAAMKQMEEQLASLPPEQRAMAEQMMKGQMGGMMGQQEAPPPPRVEALGSGEWQSYKCDKYAVYESGEKSQEVCAAPLSDIQGAEEMMQAFRAMTGFINKMTESMPMRGEGGFNPGELMDQINGFPVHMIDFEAGQQTGETSLESVTEQDVDPNMFNTPDDYQQIDPLAGR